MKSDIDAIVDDLLVRWIAYQDRKGMAAGYASASPMFRDTKSNWSPYDRDNGVCEDEAERTVMRAVGDALFAVPNSPMLWRAALLALLDLFPRTGGGATPQIGTKAKPGPLYGVSSHAWAALGVAVTAKHQLGVG